LDLIGDLAGILDLGALDMTKPPHLARAVGSIESDLLVAGAGFANCFAMSRAIIPPCPAIAA
ncbi:hypothetical protein, partial [Paenirhodobacter huangdaonensis]|uniref:hypothetical protein n=1 Tax=Paenirhodobacter huangdaonensis TaxID=2501515 RepID=UPI0019D2C13B